MSNTTLCKSPSIHIQCCHLCHLHQHQCRGLILNQQSFSKIGLTLYNHSSFYNPTLAAADCQWWSTTTDWLEFYYSATIWSVCWTWHENRGAKCLKATRHFNWETVGQGRTSMDKLKLKSWLVESGGHSIYSDGGEIIVLSVNKRQCNQH